MTRSGVVPFLSRSRCTRLGFHSVLTTHIWARPAGVVHFFGRLSFLVDENAHAVHFFISALLQLLDR